MSTLTFDPVKHVYKLDGKRLTSVTTVLGAGIPKPMLVPWAAKVAAQFAVDNPGASYDEIRTAPDRERDTAAVRGTNVHNLAEQLAHGDVVEIPEELAPYIDGYIDFLDAFKIVPVLTEKTICLEGLGVAGRFDMIATSRHLCGGTPVMIDLKTSNGVYRETAAQIAAYSYGDYYVNDDDPATRHPLPEIAGTFVAHVTPDGTFLHPFAEDAADLAADYGYFLHAHAIYRRTLAAHKVKDPIPYPSTIESAA